MREGSGEESTNGAEEPVVEDDTTPEQEPLVEERDPRRRPDPERGSERRTEGGTVPEIPRDLFEWPAAWQEYRPGEGPRRSRRRSPEGEPEIGDAERDDVPPDYRP